MRAIKMAVAMAIMAGTAPAAATYAIDATVNSFDSTRAVSWTARRPAPSGTGTVTISQSGVIAARMNATIASSTYPYTLLGGTSLGEFVAFCIEPLESVPVGTGVDYDVVQLSRAASGLGGIGDAKANQIRELFGRNLPIGGLSAMTALTNSALQLAIWEIVMESPANQLIIGDRSIGNGDFFVRNSVGATTAISLATTMLNAIDGTGPMAKGLVVLQNGRLGQSGGSQDLLAFGAVPEPSSWAMLIAGFGLTGATMRRRRIKAARI